MTDIALNQGQQAGADAFFEFLMSDDPIFVISGPAGTGKTFLTRYLITVVMKKYETSCRMIDIKPEYDEVIFTATTNKAAEVLEQALGLSVSTIHSFLGLKVRENYRTGKTELEKTKNFTIRKRKIVFIDECSMIDQELFALTKEALPDCKIVFVGDHAQMAPIGESLSQLYVEVDPANIITLTEPVRNAGQPALVALCDQLRETVETGVFRPIQEVPGVIDYLDDDLLQEGLEYIFKDLDPSCRVLAYTNTRVASFNDHVRVEVRNLPDHLTKGEVLVVNQAYNVGRVSLSVERKLEVHDVSDVMVMTRFREITGRDYEYRLVKLGLPGGNAPFDMEFPVACRPDIVTQDIKKLARQRDWADYFELKGAFLDLQPKEACTVYKAQGSTYDYVFIDLGNIGTSFSPEQVARMLYVAVSRAKSRIFLYGQLTGQYHNSKGRPLWTLDPSLLKLQASSSKKSASVLENS